MSEDKEWMRPGPVRPRLPSDSGRRNGQILNQPLYPEMGGMKGPSDAGPRNDLTIEHTKGK